MSINKFIPLKDIIYDASEDMSIDINAQFPTFKRWAIWAEKQIHSPYSWCKKVTTVTATNCFAKLPTDAMMVRAVVSGDCGCDCSDLVDGALAYAFANTTYDSSQIFLSIDVPSPGQQILGSIRYSIHNNALLFNQNVDGQTFTVQYWAMHYDCDKEEMVSENHVEAIVTYLQYKTAARSRFTPNKMELGEVEMLKRNWYMLRDNARADDAIINPSDRADIVAMINDPLIGHGMVVGMNTPNFNY